MGKKSIMSFFRKTAKQEQKDLQNRANQFMQEYRVIRARYRCDFQSYLKFKDDGGGIVALLRIIDITKRIEAEEELEKKIQEEKEKEKLKKKNGNQKH